MWCQFFFSFLGLHLLSESHSASWSSVSSSSHAVLLIECTFYTRISSVSARLTRVSVTSYTMQNGGFWRIQRGKGTSTSSANLIWNGKTLLPVAERHSNNRPERNPQVIKKKKKMELTIEAKHSDTYNRKLLQIQTFAYVKNIYLSLMHTVHRQT